MQLVINPGGSDYKYFGVDPYGGMYLNTLPDGFTGSQKVELQAGIQTTNATPTVGAAVTMNPNEMVTLTAMINGFTSTFSSGTGGILTAVFRKSGAGAATLIGSPYVLINTDSVGSPTFTALTSGNDAQIVVTGEALTTYNWVITYSFVRTRTEL